MAALPYEMFDADDHGYEPQPERLAQPAEFADELAELAPDLVRQVMRENLAGLV